MVSRRTARMWAVQLLFERDFNPNGGDLSRFRSEFKGSSAARVFAEELVRGVVERQAELDALIQQYAENWDLKRMAAVDRNIMRVAVYEMLYRSDIPPAVSINEAVELAKKMGDQKSGRFVNGILDRIRRERLSARDGAS